MLRRDWVLPSWFAYVEAACEPLGLEPEFVFVGDPEHDQATWDVIDKFADYRTVHPVIVHEDEMAPIVEHHWTFARIERMAELRNLMLQAVRSVGPAWFLSLDSDVLLHRDALTSMLAVTGFDAVGSKTFLHTRGTRIPNYAQIDPSGRLVRSDTQAFGKRVDVLMAIKLMTPAAYNVDYGVDTRGEDISWSLNCKKAGLRLGFTGDVCSKHVMHPEQLDRVDARCGY